MKKFTFPSFLISSSKQEKERIMPYRQTLIWAVIIGLAGGGIATIYYWLLKGGLFIVWNIMQPGMESLFAFSSAKIISLIILTTFGGLLVGLSVKYMRPAGEISAVVNNIHVKQGRMDFKQNPSMLVNSIVSITFGGSAGPEAPLVQLIGSSASKLGEKLKLHGDFVRTFTFCGMAAALGAFFGAPIGGALFALEIPHSRGLEYYEALIPSMVSALAGFLVFRTLVGYKGAIYHLPILASVTMINVFQGILMGLAGAALAISFIYIFRKIDKVLNPLKKRPVLLAVTGGFVIGLFAVIMSFKFIITPLFWSEYQIADLLNGISAVQANYSLWPAVGLLAALTFVKMCSVGFTLHSGYRGGFIFPLFFIGATSGVAISLATHQAIPLSVAIVGLMAAINVGVTKTPISTSVILISLTGASLFPVVAAASITSYVCTVRFRLINTQQHRTDNNSAMHRVWRWNQV
jgi:chloride channel protein, CIC family